VTCLVHVASPFSDFLQQMDQGEFQRDSALRFHTTSKLGLLMTAAEGWVHLAVVPEMPGIFGKFGVRLPG